MKRYVYFWFAFLFLVLPLAGFGQKPQPFSAIRKLIPAEIPRALALTKALEAYATNNAVDSLEDQANYLYGLIYYFQGKYILSSAAYRKVLNGKYARENPLFLEYTQNNLGVDLEILGEYDKALLAYSESEKLARARGDSMGMAKTWLNMALLKQLTGDKDGAMAYNQHARAFFEGKKDKVHLGLSYLNEAGFRMPGDIQGARRDANKARSLFSAAGDTLNLLKTLSQLVEIGMAGDDITLVRSSLDAGLDLSKLGEIFIPVRVKILLQGVAWHGGLGRTAKAGAMLAEAKQWNEQLETREHQFQLFIWETILSAWRGDAAAVEAGIISWEKEYQQSMDRKSRAHYEELAALMEKEKLQAEISLLKQSNARKNQTILLVVLLIGLLAGGLLLFIYQSHQIHQRDRRIIDLNVPKILPGITPDQVMKDGSADKLFPLFLDLQQLMEKEKWYMRPGLTISDLSSRLMTNNKYLSSVVNQYARMTFTQYISQLRIRDAKLMLLTENGKKTVNEVAIQCGFGNASSFIRTFRELTGTTPVGFVKTVQKYHNS